MGKKKFIDKKKSIKFQLCDSNSYESQPAVPLPVHIRREILAMGFPDDGYNYFMHLRDITNLGGMLYHNYKAKLGHIPIDVKAYDASEVELVSGTVGNGHGDFLCSVAEKTFNVEVQKAYDSDVAALLDANDSRFGSDVDELEEDFIRQANSLEVEGEMRHVEVHHDSEALDVRLIEGDERKNCHMKMDDRLKSHKSRAPRGLDEEFEHIMQQEYITNSDTDHDANNHNRQDGHIVAELSDSLTHILVDEYNFDDKYRAPADFLNGDRGTRKGDQVHPLSNVISKCSECAEMYMHENEDVVVTVDFSDVDSSDESENWDCETIISTYSNLENHPRKIEIPENSRNKLSCSMSGDLSRSNHVISLHGKAKLPVDSFTISQRTAPEKIWKGENFACEHTRRQYCGYESREARRGRKIAAKELRREARRVKKKLKERYKCEAQLAQKVAAAKFPCSIHFT